MRRCSISSSSGHRGSVPESPAAWCPISSCSVSCSSCPSISNVASSSVPARTGLELMVMPLALGITAPVAGRTGRSARCPTTHHWRHVGGGARTHRSWRPSASDPGVPGLCWPSWASVLDSSHLRTMRPSWVGSPGTVRFGLGHPQHDPGHGYRPRAGADRSRVRSRRRTIVAVRISRSCFLGHGTLFLAALALLAGAIAGLRGGRPVELSS